MPSIAYFIKELLTEEKYSSAYSDRIEERIQALNAAQLQGMYNHLVSTANKSKTDMWKSSNQEIIDRIAKTLAQRTKDEQIERKIIEEYRLKQKQKRQGDRDAKREKIRVMHMIEEKAHITAETEIRDLENQREAAEKLTIIKAVYKGEELRNRWLIALSLVLIVTVVLVVILVTDIIYIIAIVGGILIMTLILAYRAYLFTDIRPKRIMPSELAERITERQAALKEEALEQLREKERKFQEQQKKDRIERRKLRAIRQERKEYEAEVMEQQRLDRIRMAHEVISRKEHSQRVQQQAFESESKRQLESVNQLEAVQESDGEQGNTDVQLFQAENDNNASSLDQQTYQKIIKRKYLFHHNNPGEGDYNTSDDSAGDPIGFASSHSSDR